MVANGLNLNNVDVVGFSMGGQIAGLVGKTLNRKSGMKLPAIFSLGASIIPGLERLDVKDATFIMSVFTEYRFRDPNVKSHVNFFFNKELRMLQCLHVNFDYCKLNLIFKNHKI